MAFLTASPESGLNTFNTSESIEVNKTKTDMGVVPEEELSGDMK